MDKRCLQGSPGVESGGEESDDMVFFKGRVEIRPNFTADAPMFDLIGRTAG